MKQSKLLYAGALALCAIVVGIFFALSPEDARIQTGGKKGYSIFDSEFWRGDSGKTTLSANDRYLELKTQRNLSTGKNFTEEEIKRIKYLAERFPNNRLIPRMETAEERRQRLAHEKEMREVGMRLDTGTGTEEDVERLFQDRRKLMLDRLQLVRFVLEEEPHQWDPKVQKKYRQMLKHGRFVLKQLKDRKRRSLEALRARQRAGATSGT